MILRWTLQKMRRTPASVFASASAVAAAFVMSLAFEALWAGESEQLVVYIEETGADVWVMQRGVSNMHMATSFIADSYRDRVAEVDGVARSAGILYLNSLVRAGNRDWFCYIVGVDESDQIGAAWSVSEGSTDLGSGEAIIPDVLAAVTGLELGDEIGIANRTFTIVGMSEGTFSMGNPITFVNAVDLSEILSLVGYDSYILVEAEPGVDAEALAARIRENTDDGVNVLPTDAFMANDRELASQMGVELIGLITTISTGLAILLVAFALYIHTSRCRRDLAVLKALGFRSRHVYASVALQAALLTGIALGLALAVTAVLVLLAPSLLPELSIELSAPIVIKVALTGFAVALVATFVAARQVAKVDPLTAFHT